MFVTLSLSRAAMKAVVFILLCNLCNFFSDLIESRSVYLRHTTFKA